MLHFCQKLTNFKCGIFDHVLNEILQFLRHMEAVIFVFPDKVKGNNWQSYVKTLFAKFHCKYQKIVQKNQIFV